MAFSTSSLQVVSHGAALISVPIKGESVKAAIELHEGIGASRELGYEILAHARMHLAGYKVPCSIDFEEKLPGHPSGKLYIRRLWDPYWLDRARSI